MQNDQDNQKDLTANPLDQQTDTEIEAATEAEATTTTAPEKQEADIPGDEPSLPRAEDDVADPTGTQSDEVVDEMAETSSVAKQADAAPSSGTADTDETPLVPQPATDAEPSAEQEPSAGKEPSAEQEPSAGREPSAEQEPSAEEEPSAEQEPAATPALSGKAGSLPIKTDEVAQAPDATAEPEVDAESPETEETETETETGAETAAEPEPKSVPEKVPFSRFNLVPALARAIADLGFDYCTPIQAQSLRYTLVGYDVTGKAQTGTGKTAAFLITIINDLLRNPQREQRYIGEPRALVLAPTRELVMQIANDAEDLCKHTGLHVVTLVGGEDYQRQLRAVDKKPVDIVVATPGRLIDFLQQDHLYLGLIELLVIDEADRMLDMGFIPQVRNIVARTPHKDCRQTLLFSATFTPEILELTSRWAMDPIMIEIAPERVATETVEQIVYLVTSEAKYNLLYNLIGLQGSDKVIIFSNRRDQVRKLADNLHRHGVNCGMLSGEVAQKKRIQTLEGFRDGKIKVLVATDVAGRGLHIDDVTHVINYTLPEEAEDYVHRIGRTGRAGAVGTSISFACEEDSFLLPNIEEKLGQKLPCVHPDSALLAEPPPFTRASRFKDEGKTTGGRGGRGGSSRSGGGRSRPQQR